jgi:hypothetical protein
MLVLLNGRDLWSLPLKWAQVAWYIVHNKFHDDRLDIKQDYDYNHNNLRGCVVGTADPRDLRSISLRWLLVAWYRYQVSWRLVQEVKQYSRLFSEIWKAVILVLLMEGIYKLRRWDEVTCRDIHTKFHKDWFRHSEVNRWDRHTDTQQGDIIRLLTIFFAK